MSKATPPPAQGIRSSWIRGDVEQHITHIHHHTGGSGFGRGVWSWKDWLQRSHLEAGNGVSAQETRRCVANGVIPRRFERELEGCVRSTMLKPAVGNVGFGVVGTHGSGLTWTLFGAAHRLAAAGLAEDLIVVDDPELFIETDLVSLLEGRGRVILVIDDAEQQDALRPIKLASRIGLTVMFSTANRDYAELLLAACPSSQSKILELPPGPDPDELEMLKTAAGMCDLSHALRRETARGTMRSIARVLNENVTTQDVVHRLSSLRSREDETISRGMAVLLRSTASDAMVPQAMLLRFLQRDTLPRELKEWVQVRPFCHGYQVQNLLWIEDRRAASTAESAWGERQQLDWRTISEQRTQVVRELIEIADHRQPLDRRFIRRLVRRLSGQEQQNLGVGVHAVLLEMAGAEKRIDFAFSWLPILQGLGVDVSDLARRKRQAHEYELRDSADLVLTLYELGGWATAELLSQIMEGSSGWKVSDWVGLVAMMEYLPVRRRDELASTAAPLLRELGPRKTISVLTGGNTTQILAPAIERTGRPDDRLWLLEHLKAVVRERPHAVGHFVSLGKRCIMQGRNELALETMRSLYQPDGVMLGRLSESYDRVRCREQQEHLAQDVTQLLHGMCTQGAYPARIIDGVWEGLLDFSRPWSPIDLPQFSTECMDSLWSFRSTLPARYLSRMMFSSLVAASRCGSLRLSDVGSLTGEFRHSSSSVPSALRFILMLSAIAAAVELPISGEAARALGALLYAKGQPLRGSLEAFSDATQASLNSEHRIVLPSWLFRIDHFGRSPLVARAALSSFRLAESPGSRVAAGKLLTRYGGQRNLASHLTNALLHLREPDLVLGISPENSGNLNIDYRRVTAFAQAGDMTRARAGLREATLRYEGPGRGAHPHVVHRTLTEVASGSTGEERLVYSMIAALVHLAPLEDRASFGRVAACRNVEKEEVLRLERGADSRQAHRR